MKKCLVAALATLALSGCASFQSNDKNWQAPVSQLTNLHKGVYVVRRGDTLRNVAYGLNVNASDLAKWNHLQPPYQLYIGQTLYLSQQPEHHAVAAKPKAKPLAMEPGPVIYTPPPKMSKPKVIVNKQPTAEKPKTIVKHEKPETTVAHKPKSVPKPNVTKVVAKPKPEPKPNVTKVAATPKPSPKKATVPAVSSKGWVWPVNGKVSDMGKTVNIAARPGTPVVAAKGGTVVYTGPDVSGTGQMVIISHGDGLLSAYGYLKSVNVKEHAQITRASKIGQVGSVNGTGELHFEIRQNGKLKNPRLYLS